MVSSFPFYRQITKAWQGVETCPHHCLERVMQPGPVLGTVVKGAGMENLLSDTADSSSSSLPCNAV